jgi:hypothetical protein
MVVVEIASATHQESWPVLPNAQIFFFRTFGPLLVVQKEQFILGVGNPPHTTAFSAIRVVNHCKLVLFGVGQDRVMLA